MSRHPTKDFQKIDYSELLRGKLMQINSHNVSCLYKATLQKHATEVLHDCEDDFDSYYCYSDKDPEARFVDWKPPYKGDPNGHGDPDDVPCNQTTLENSDNHADRSQRQYYDLLNGQLYKIKAGMLLKGLGLDVNLVNDEDTWSDKSADKIKHVTASLEDYYKNIRLYAEERFRTNNICGWRVCRGGHLDGLDPALLQFHSNNDIFSESTRKLINRRQYALKTATSGERVPFSTNIGQSHPSSANLQDGKVVSEKQYKEKNANNQNATTVKSQSTKTTKAVPKKSSRPKQKQRSLSAISPKPKTQTLDVLKPSVQNLTEAPISYQFKHNPGYRTGYIQQYREQYTVKKLEHILLQCAQRYYQSKQQQTVAKAAVQCTDVRDGACLVNEGSPRIHVKKKIGRTWVQGHKPLGLVMKKPSPVKVSQYKFDMVQNFRTHSVMRQKQQDKPCPKSSNCSVDSSPCPTPVEHKKTEMPTSFSLSGVHSFKMLYPPSETENASITKALDAADDSTDDKEAEQSESVLSKILRGGSPIVSRSRPTIPSNSRGLVYASSVETPLHVVTGSKPLCIGKRKFDKHGNFSTGVESTNVAHDTTDSTGQSQPGCDATAESSGADVGVTPDQIPTHSTEDLPENYSSEDYADQSMHTVSAPTVGTHNLTGGREMSTIMQKTMAIVTHTENTLKEEGPSYSEIYRDGFACKVDTMMEGPTEPVLLLPKPQVPSVRNKTVIGATVKKIYRQPFIKKK